MRLVLPLAQREAGNLDATVNRHQKPLTKLVASKFRFLPGGRMGKHWACRPKFGRSRPHSGTQKAQSPALIPSPAKMRARPMR